MSALLPRPTLGNKNTNSSDREREGWAIYISLFTGMGSAISLSDTGPSTGGSVKIFSPVRGSMVPSIAKS
jgi:hypothetical protein